MPWRKVSLIAIQPCVGSRGRSQVIGGSACRQMLGRAEVGDGHVLDVARRELALEAQQVLSPVEIAVDQDVFGMAAGERVEPGKVVGTGRERDRERPERRRPRPRRARRRAGAPRATAATAPFPASAAISGNSGRTWRTPMLVRDGMTIAR